MARITLFAALALALAAAGPAAAQTAWTSAPTLVDVAAAYPAKARAAGVGGSVQMMCTAGREGQMTDCLVIQELPTGYGFGVAARKLAAGIVATGVERKAEVRVPIQFPVELAKGEPVTVRAPLWSGVPSVEALQAAILKADSAANDARVTLLCDVQAGGTLSGCAVDREEPAGQGFGQAVLALAPQFRTHLLSADGAPTVGAKVRVPVRFALKPVNQAAK